VKTTRQWFQRKGMHDHTNSHAVRAGWKAIHRECWVRE
jgi:hypothetical protein